MNDTIKPLVAGNWKMNGLTADLDEFRAMCQRMTPALAKKADCMICGPATLLSRLKGVAGEGPITVGGQDCHAARNGAHTGDISAPMLADAGASAVIVGHSERRADHGETSQDVRNKAMAAWSSGLTAIICVGETEAERKAGQAIPVVSDQLIQSVPDGAQAENTVIAYEPVWAIGTGLTPTTDDVAEMHAAARKVLIDRIGEEGNKVRLLYGGSVKPANAAALMAVEDVNGALVGGASLKASDFMAIVETYN
ncbi:MAG: triose-phosphate isomerase [Roseibium sp.]|nr:triose-phosphate isomerase [Roseibium sp.]